MKLRPSTLMGMRASIALSHCGAKNITHGVLFCESPAQATHIGHVIAHVAGAACHPGLIPGLICNFGLEVLQQKINKSWHESFAVETSSDRTVYSRLNDDAVIALGRDDPEIDQKVTISAKLGANWATLTESATELIKSVSGFLASHDAVSADESIQAVQIRQKEVIGDFLSLATQRGICLQRNAQHIKSRAEIQMSTVYNRLAQKSNQINLGLASTSSRTAIEAQKDAAAMKSVVVLTMTFLPATFIATLFATPGIASTSPSQGIYWAVTLPLTLVVLMAWIGWTLSTMRRIEGLIAVAPVQRLGQKV